ncbi:MAG: ATP-binding cassette domain-containing protein [Prevotella sp.]|nr:ATP-binding cassette domain-containing protein [Candidatus Prevotella equi]
MITIKNLEYRYPKSKRLVFKDLNLCVGDGKIHGLLGMNGAGKSTLLYLMSSLLLPSGGVIEVNGKDVSKRTAEVLSEIFIVPEEYDLPAISLAEYVEVNKPFYPLFNEAKMYEYISAFKQPQDINLGQLSMGQKKKVYMCFALATGVKLILMDEPTNGMDIPSKTIFRDVIRQVVNEDRTILISTHQVKDVETLLDNIIIIDQSKIILNESIADIKKDKGLSEDSTIDLEQLFNEVMSGNYKEGGAR